VVTTRKQEELLQKVPITVHALSTDAIENIAPKILADLGTLTPGLNYQDIGGGRSGGRIQMRGISGGITGVSRAAIFLDGVYLTGDIQNIPFQFMQRIEVLSGPQSAQFGRSTFAGAINYVTKDAPGGFRARQI
jgi:iron complex outermembrane recepter protein